MHRIMGYFTFTYHVVRLVFPPVLAVGCVCVCASVSTFSYAPAHVTCYPVPTVVCAGTASILAEQTCFA
ncbi:hypothetical protein BGZ63DRAFT_369079 [Mariannaea sp. PMI_226]|nr:hypothetical protein BGZ63DRAFT_369079 [Mariannaea sp. PMI_226]